MLPGGQERPFETREPASFLRRVRSVAQSPGGILLSFAAALLLVGIVPALSGAIAGNDGPAAGPAVAPSREDPGELRYVRVVEGESLYDIARTQAPDVPVSEAMTELSVLNDLGDRDPRPGTLISVPSW